EAAEASAEGPSGTVARPSRPSPGLRQRFRIRLKDGGEMERSSLDLIRLIKDGRLRPDDEVVAEGSLDWRRAEQIDELSRYFELRAETERAPSAAPRTAPPCINHRTVSSNWRCGSCGECFCQDCVKIER